MPKPIKSGINEAIGQKQRPIFVCCKSVSTGWSDEDWTITEILTCTLGLSKGSSECNIIVAFWRINIISDAKELRKAIHSRQVHISEPGGVVGALRKHDDAAQEAEKGITNHCDRYNNRKWFLIRRMKGTRNQRWIPFDQMLALVALTWCLRSQRPALNR